MLAFATGSTERGKGGLTDRRDVLERIVKNVQNGIISKVKIRVFVGGENSKARCRNTDN